MDANRKRQALDRIDELADDTPKGRLAKRLVEDMSVNDPGKTRPARTVARKTRRASK